MWTQGSLIVDLNLESDICKYEGEFITHQYGEKQKYPRVKELEFFHEKKIKTFFWLSITMTQVSIIQKEILFLESKIWIFLHKVKVLNHLLCSGLSTSSCDLMRI